MSKVAVVYWSGTGNTQMMADAVAAGAKGAGADVTVMGPSEFHHDSVAEYDAIAFGCPAMGAEVLEETEFEPMFAGVESALNGKKIGLFGSWGWGNGAWMQEWEQRCIGDGAKMVMPGVICANAPDDTAIAECNALGVSLA